MPDLRVPEAARDGRSSPFTQQKALLRTAALAFLALLIVGCSSTAGRVKTEGEGDLVGAYEAGGETFQRLIAETTRRLLDDQAEEARQQGKAVIAFVGIDNKSREEIGDASESMYEIIDTIIIESRIFTNVSRRYVDSALRETGLRVESLFLSGGIERFTRVLRREGFVPDYLLWAKLTSMSTQGAEGVSQRDYLLTLELVDAASGLVVAKKTAKVSKEYVR